MFNILPAMSEELTELLNEMQRVFWNNRFKNGVDAQGPTLRNSDLIDLGWRPGISVLYKLHS